MVQSIAIIFVCVAAAIVYGILHDQITARICIEYFTIGHPRLIDSEVSKLQGLSLRTICLALGSALELPDRRYTLISPSDAAQFSLSPTESSGEGRGEGNRDVI